ncbi:ComEC/Rec2 family competence protein [Aquella oligotrophica]|uniref:ComEC/Rec2-related protein domain-containing protein n=1 Tax=Aquella oligotrophica TaxID=2067065 RepID=A0A2I7N6R7_9NEIS|nr:ComEC/Rec2 family competence protein [Aquella oligotrophica]AUR52130.1 hypothetical protein CUN60_07385 [Aquella oligotrophica]
MFNYLALAAGIFSALFYPLISSKSLAFFILLPSITIYVFIAKQKLILSNILILKCILLILAGYSYSSLRLIHSQEELIRESIPSILLSGYLASIPVNDIKGLHAEFKITDGTFSSNKIILYFPESSNLIAGNMYLIKANLKPLDITSNIHANDYRQYLINNHISGFGYLQEILVNQGSDYSPWSQLTKIRYSTVNYLRNASQDSKYSGLMIALISGYQNLIPTSQWQLFRNTGIIHLVSISGLHITLVATIVIFLVNYILRRLPMKFTIPLQIIAIWFGLVAAFCYSIFAGFSIPTQRTFYLLLISAVLLSSRRHTPLLHKLTIAGTLVLLIDPFAGLSSSFWLSFGLVATIFMLSTAYQKSMNKVKFWFTLQFAITLVSFPISLYLFKTYSLVSIIANLWAVPLIGTVLTPLLLVTALFHITPGIALMAKALIWIMIPIEYLGKIPPYLQISPSLPTILICYLGIILFFIPKSLPYKNITGLILFCSLFMTASDKIELGRIKYIDFSSSLASISLIQTNTANILIDIPYNEDEQSQLKAINNSLLPYLQTEYISHINYFITTTSSSTIESGVINLLANNQITLDKTRPEKDAIIDGLAVNFTSSDKSFALIIKDSLENYYYFGNGINPIENNGKWKTVTLIAYPWRNPEWIYNSHIDTLIISSPSIYKNKITRITDNLNLDAKKIHDTGKNGSFSFISH